MTESEQGRGNNLPVRDVPIDWESLEDAFENNAPEVHSYLHLVSGEVLRVVDGIADPEMHARIASDPAYLRIEPVSSREQYRWMERFIPMVDEPVLRAQLSQAIDGKGAFRRLKRAQILLAADGGSTDADIAANVAVGTSTVYRTKKRFVEEGLDAALSEEPRPGAERKLSASEEALLIATACSTPPAGRARWTLDLLAGEMVRLTPHSSLSSETIRRRLAGFAPGLWSALVLGHPLAHSIPLTTAARNDFVARLRRSSSPAGRRA